MEKNAKNRVMEGLDSWQQKENNLKSIFGDNVVREKHFLKGKMDFLNDLHKTIKPDANNNEKLLLNIVKGETNKLERTIHPNLISRLFVKAVGVLKEQVNAFTKKHQPFNNDFLSLNTKNNAPVGIKDQRNNKQAAKNEQSPEQILKQQKKQSANLNNAKREDNKLADDTKSLLPKNRISNNKGHNIY